jgi:putative hemolysin
MSQLLPPFLLRWARTEADLRAAMALRHRVFVQELGGQGGGQSSPGQEADEFDDHCRHLLLLDSLCDGQVVGTTRVMTEDGARAAGGFASENEFDLSALRRSGRRLLEVGRTCLLPQHRGGSAMHRLWQGLAALVEEQRIELLFGLASFPGTDPAAIAQPLACLHHDHLAAEALRPASRRTVPMDRLSRDALDRRAAVLAMPALVKAYLRLGGKVGEGAFLDPAFRCIDVCLVLDTAVMGPRARAIYGPGRR